MCSLLLFWDTQTQKNEGPHSHVGTKQQHPDLDTISAVLPKILPGNQLPGIKTSPPLTRNDSFYIKQDPPMGHWPFWAWVAHSCLCLPVSVHFCPVSGTAVGLLVSGCTRLGNRFSTLASGSSTPAIRRTHICTPTYPWKTQPQNINQTAPSSSSKCVAPSWQPFRYFCFGARFEGKITPMHFPKDGLLEGQEGECFFPFIQVTFHHPTCDITIWGWKALKSGIKLTRTVWRGQKKTGNGRLWVLTGDEG